MINLVCIDGGSGSLRGSKLRNQFKRLLKCRGPQPVKAHYLRSAVIPILRAIRRWKIRKALLKYASPENTLILAGKSIGAIWALRALEKLPLPYGKVFLCTVDPHDPITQRYSYPVLARITQGWNVFQRNDRPRGGRVQHDSVSNFGVGRSDVNHWNIIFCREAVDAIKAALDAALDDS
ncbi:hypothetical protein LCGC14_2079430 [marine sediment metagenome]|uniref:Uncharacterized protein n=1 Tax=marine sediment metagenome TaxID=412755 RepID=A0A0F9F3D7_9ZZZZ